MRKLINDPFACVDEMIGGLQVAFPGLIEVTRSGRGLIFAHRDPGRRIAIVTGGGSGHEPAFYGYLGRGLADGAALGNVFASPPAEPAIEVAEHLHASGAEGVLLVFGNYDGDIMNFGLASDFLIDRGIPCETVLVTDDVVSAPAAERADRRGVAGDVVVVKAAGARADEGAGLAEVAAAARLANGLTRTAGVGLGPCVVPTAGVPTFELPEGEMDIGMGIHGERGIRRTALAPADAVADELLELILQDGAGDLEWPFLVLVNTLGATPLMEAMIVLRRVAERLGELGFEVARALVGEYVTSLEMAGLSLTLTALEPELAQLIEAPARALHAPHVGWWDTC